DLPGQLDEARVDTLLPRRPGQVEGIDGDAVSPEARPGVKGLKAERLGLRRGDYLPDVDAHRVEDDFQLVDQGDVDRPIGVLEDLARLRHARAGDGHDAVDNRLVQGDGEVTA